MNNKIGGTNMNSIEDKILTLVKLASPDDPVDYIQGIVKKYAIDKINSDIKSCNNCSLCEFGVKTISYGDYDSKILMIGESVFQEQYEQNNKVALPLSNSDGDTLNRALGVLKANKDAIYIANSVNCYPAKINNGQVIKRIPGVKERTECKKHIDRLIDAIKPHVIIALGSVSANALSPTKISIMEARGKQFDYRGYPVIPTFHPGFFREMSSKFEEDILNLYKDNFLLDLYNAFMIAKEKDPNCKIGDITLPF